jgi:transcriptional regulator with XRE-family HTH domain
MSYSVQRSTKDWQVFVGTQCRELRIRANLTQEELAVHAGLSIGAVKKLEQGAGSSLGTLIKILRVLKRTDWLSALAPPVSVSPLQMLRAQRANTPRARVRKPKAIVGAK